MKLTLLGDSWTTTVSSSSRLISETKGVVVYEQESTWDDDGGSDARASALAKRMIWHPCMCLRQDPRKRDLQWNWHVKNWNARNAKRNRRRVLNRLSMNKEEPSKCVMSELVDNNNCARDPRSGWYLRRPNRPVGGVLLSLVSITHGGSQCGPKSSALWTDWSPHKRYNWKKLVRGISNL